jgi:hypothetical protein
MTPTISSTIGKNTTATQSSAASSQNTTPSLASAGPIKGRGWLKRAGLSRDPGTLRSKKEGRLNQRNGMIFPDKVYSLVFSNLLILILLQLAIDSSRQDEDTNGAASRVSTSDKPLPSPPIVQINGSGPQESPRSLIDASEKPLRRASPLRGQNSGEEWPVLFPTKPTPPVTLRMVAASGEVANALDYEPPERERYPAVVNADIAPLANPESTTKQRLIERKTSAVNKETGCKPVKALESYIVDNTKHIENITKVDAANDMSAAAAALEKFEENGAKNHSHTIPNGTASLRARILSKSELEDTAKASRGYSGEPRKATAGSLLYENAVSSYDQHPIDFTLEKSQRQRLGLNGRINSRGRFPVAPQPTKVTAKLRETSSTIDKAGQPAELVAVKRPVPKNANRRSSIPVFIKKNVLLSQGAVDNEPESPSEVLSSKLKVKTAETDAFAIFEDSRAYDGDDEGTRTKHGLMDEYKVIAELNPFEETFGRSKTVQVPGVTHGRPPSDIPEDLSTIRRLSRTYLEHGATLIISDQANSVIYGGKNADGEDATSTPKGNGNGLHRAVVTNELMKDHAPPNVTSSRVRPLSIYELESSGPSLNHIKPEESKDPNVKHRITADDDDPFVDRPKSRAPGNPSAVSEDVLKKTINNKIPTGDSSAISKAGSEESASKSLAPMLAETPSTDRITSIPDHDSLQRLRAAQKNLQQTHRGSIRSPTPNQGHHQTAGFARPTSSSEKRARNSIAQVKPEPTKSNRPVTPSGLNQVYLYPPRSSSRTPVEGIPGRPNDNLNTDKQTAPTSIQKFKEVKTQPEDAAAASNFAAFDEAKVKRVSYASGKSMLSMKNLRGLFHKNDSEKKSTRGKKTVSERVATPIPTSLRLHTGNSTVAEAEKTTTHSTGPTASNTNQASAPSTHVNEIAETTSLATQILNSARDERSNAKKERLLQMGKVMVDAITSARDAEVAMEQAKVAAKRAQMSYMLTRKSVMDVSRMVRDWKKILEGGKLLVPSFGLCIYLSLDDSTYTKPFYLDTRSETRSTEAYLPIHLQPRSSFTTKRKAPLVLCLHWVGLDEVGYIFKQ